MLYADSPAVQARVDAYQRKPSLAPDLSTRLAAQWTLSSQHSLNRVVLVTAAIRELSTIDPED